MKKLLASDNSLKVISVLTAICIWIYIAIVMDPAIEVTVRDLPIQFVGHESLETKNLAVISESATYVTIKIKGSRKKMGNNDMKTIIAKSDVSYIDGEGVSPLPIEIVIPFENQGITYQSLYTVDVKTEKLVSKDMDIQVKTTGTLAEDYMSGDLTADPGKVTVKGPESAVEKLSVAVAELNVAGADVDIDADTPIAFYDADSKQISELDAIYKRVKLSATSTKIHCPVHKIRTVKTEPNFGDQELPEHFSYKIEPSELYVYGEDPRIAQITGIQTEEIPLSRLLDNDKIKVKLIIPKGVRILYDINEVEISVEK